MWDIYNALTMYELSGLDIDLFMMSRPWLSADDFNLDKLGLNDVFEAQIDSEITSWLDPNTTSSFKRVSSNKVNNIKNYSYKDIFMDKYGEPLLDKDNQLIGFKLNDF